MAFTAGVSDRIASLRGDLSETEFNSERKIDSYSLVCASAVERHNYEHQVRFLLVCFNISRRKLGCAELQNAKGSRSAGHLPRICRSTSVSASK